MNNTDFKKFLDDKSWDYNKKTIEQMMEKELEKEPEEINMEFVDACMNYLTGYSENTAPKEDKVVGKNTHHKRIKLSRLLIAAIIIIVSVSVGVTAYAKVNDMKISDVFVEIFSEHATIDYSNKENTTQDTTIPYNSTKLYKELQEGGIENIALPTDLYSANYESLNWFSDDISKSVGFVAEIENKKVSVSIETFAKESYVANIDIQGQFTASKKIEVNGIEVYLFERYGDKYDKALTTISYQAGLTQYGIDCHCSIDEAEQFIKNMN